MGKITVSAELAALLPAATAKSELIGPDGYRVGYFVPQDQLPTIEERPDLYAEPTREELDRIAADGDGIPHDEVVKRSGLE